MFVPFGIGVIIANFPSDGKVPVDMERLNNLCSESAMLRAVTLSILGEMPSLSVDLVVSRSVTSSNTDSSVHRSSLGHSLGGR